MLNPDIKQALKLIQAPASLSVRGRNVSPDLLFCPTLAEPLAHWLSSSISRRMLDQIGTGGEFIADPNHLMGMRWNKSAELTHAEHINSHGAATQLLIMCEALSQVLAPAQLNPQYDYAELLVTFRDQVDYHYEPGMLVHPDDVFLHKILYNKLHSPQWQTQKPAQAPVK